MARAAEALRETAAEAASAPERGAALAPLPAVELSDVTVRFPFGDEEIATFKEFAIKSLKGRISRGELVALRGVSLTIRPGETVGVIGPNGAGKSTLFRVIAHVRRPSAGRVVVRGRVAPLLELGLGLHGELTGRENILLQGSLMGFSRKEMLVRVPRIAAFAEVEPFLDTPIRKYSTGMAARLAFSVATDVDPDILLVDEALSVGDERFRVKCRERMASFRDRGKTFLLVSHALGDIVQSCRRAIWIAEGRIVRDGPAAAVTAEYLTWSQSGNPSLPGEG